MEELKCKECGAVLAPDAKECPSCGCPVEEAVKTDCPVKEEVKTECQAEEAIETEPAAPKKEKQKSKFNIAAVISLLLGVAIIVMGITVINKETGMETFSAEYYNVDYAKFGGDFYTCIYDASDTMVDELNDINNGVELLSESMSTLADVIYFSAGMIIIAIGIGVSAVSVNHIKKEDK